MLHICARGRELTLLIIFFLRPQIPPSYWSKPCTRIYFASFFVVASTTCTPNVIQETTHLHGPVLFSAQSVLIDSNQCDIWSGPNVNYWLATSLLSSAYFVVDYCREIPVYGVRTRNGENHGSADRSTKQFRIEVSTDNVII